MKKKLIEALEVIYKMRKPVMEKFEYTKDDHAFIKEMNKTIIALETAIRFLEKQKGA